MGKTNTFIQAFLRELIYLNRVTIKNVNEKFTVDLHWLWERAEHQ